MALSCLLHMRTRPRRMEDILMEMKKGNLSQRLWFWFICFVCSVFPLCLFSISADDAYILLAINFPQPEADPWQDLLLRDNYKYLQRNIQDCIALWYWDIYRTVLLSQCSSLLCPYSVQIVLRRLRGFSSLPPISWEDTLPPPPPSVRPARQVLRGQEAAGPSSPSSPSSAWLLLCFVFLATLARSGHIDQSLPSSCLNTRTLILRQVTVSLAVNTVSGQAQPHQPLSANYILTQPARPPVFVPTQPPHSTPSLHHLT